MGSLLARTVDRSFNANGDATLTKEQLQPFMTDDCIWEFGGNWPAKNEGIDKIVEGFNHFHSGFKAGVHHYTNRVIDTKNKRMCWYSDATWIKKEVDEKVLVAGNYEA